MTIIEQEHSVDATNSPTPAVPIIEARNVHRHFEERPGLFSRGSKRAVKAVDGVSFAVERGTNFGIVGESGSGKTTLTQLLLRLQTPTAGHVLFKGVDLAKMDRQQVKEYRRSTHVVFQDPNSSLSPRLRVRDIVAEPLAVRGDPGDTIKERVEEVLELVGLDRSAADRYPHQFSGGQRQRIAIARAVAGHPDLVILDEPVSALDVSIRAQILNLLNRIQQRLQLSYVTVAHDLTVVYHSCDRVAVMYLGRIVELADTEDLYRRPRHPYSQALLASAPSLRNPGRLKDLMSVSTEIPSPVDIPSGCRFHTRCPLASEQCVQEDPVWREVAPRQWVACHFA